MPHGVQGVPFAAPGRNRRLATGNWPPTSNWPPATGDRPRCAIPARRRTGQWPHVSGSDHLTDIFCSQWNFSLDTTSPCSHIVPQRETQPDTETLHARQHRPRRRQASATPARLSQVPRPLRQRRTRLPHRRHPQTHRIPLARRRPPLRPPVGRRPRRRHRPARGRTPPPRLRGRREAGLAQGRTGGDGAPLLRRPRHVPAQGPPPGALPRRLPPAGHGPPPARRCGGGGGPGRPDRGRERRRRSRYGEGGSAGRGGRAGRGNAGGGRAGGCLGRSGAGAGHRHRDARPGRGDDGGDGHGGGNGRSGRNGHGGRSRRPAPLDGRRTMPYGARTSPEPRRGFGPPVGRRNG